MELAGLPEGAWVLDASGVAGPRTWASEGRIVSLTGGETLPVTLALECTAEDDEDCLLD